MPEYPNPSMPEAFSRVVSDLADLMQKEMRLAKAEIANKITLGIRAGVTAILGGPRIDHRLARELGYDAGFGPGTKPSDVANYVVGEVLRRMGKES